jgi:hypothetical protein
MTRWFFSVPLNLHLLKVVGNAARVYMREKRTGIRLVLRKKKTWFNRLRGKNEEDRTRKLKTKEENRQNKGFRRLTEWEGRKPKDVQTKEGQTKKGHSAWFAR